LNQTQSKEKKNRRTRPGDSAQAAHFGGKMRLKTPGIDERFRMTNRRRIIIDIVYWTLIIALIYVIAKYALGYIAPFVIGAVVAALVQPVIQWAAGRVKWNVKVISVLSVTVFYCTVGLLMVVGAIAMISYLISWFPQLTRLYFMIEPSIREWIESLNENIQLLDPGIGSVVESMMDNLIDSLGTMVKDFTTTAVSGLGNVLASVPNIFIGLLFTIISTFFISAEYQNITSLSTHSLNPAPRRYCATSNAIWERSSGSSSNPTVSFCSSPLPN